MTEQEVHDMVQSYAGHIYEKFALHKWTTISRGDLRQAGWIAYLEMEDGVDKRIIRQRVYYGMIDEMRLLFHVNSSRSWREYRALKLSVCASIDDPSFNAILGYDPTDEIHDAIDREQRIARHIKRKRDPQRMTRIIDQYLAGYTMGEIGRSMGTSESAVCRALKDLYV